MRLALTIQYLGTRYTGWQTQTNAVGVQQVVEEALATLFGSPLRIHGAGRTDAGAHAAARRSRSPSPRTGSFDPWSGASPAHSSRSAAARWKRHASSMRRGGPRRRRG